MIYILLFYEFFKIGLFAIGGGLVTVPFLFDLAEAYPWFTTEDLANMIAISESTPGPLGVNMATFAGYKAAGISGAVIATLGLVTPSVKDEKIFTDLFNFAHSADYRLAVQPQPVPHLEQPGTSGGKHLQRRYSD